MKWKFKNKYIKDPPKEVYGFVYKVTCKLDEYKDWIYIGSKSFYKNRTTVLSKKKANELYLGKGRKPKKQKVTTESDWKDYITSSETIKTLVNTFGNEAFNWEIIDYGLTKADLLMKEVEMQVKYRVFRIKESFNQMLKASIYKKNLI